jgi:hypothetical protein
MTIVFLVLKNLSLHHCSPGKRLNNSCIYITVDLLVPGGSFVSQGTIKSRFCLTLACVCLEW